MQVFAIINQKGGSAKTTTAVNLASALVEKKNKVLLLDLDPQGSASNWLGFREASKGLFSVFVENGSISDIVSNTSIAGLDIIPSSSFLVGADKMLAGEVAAETILKRKLAEIKNKTWDYILIDCPPTLGLMSLNALTAANNVLVPLETHIMAVQGLVQLIQTIRAIKDRLNPSLEIHGILPCRVNRKTRLAQDIIADLRKRFGDKIYRTTIRESVRLAEAPSFGKPINLYDPKSSGAEDYRGLASEITRRSKESNTARKG